MKKTMSLFLIIVLVLLLCISVNAESNVKKSNISLSKLNNQYMEEALSNPNLTLQQRNEIIKKYEFVSKANKMKIEDLSDSELEELFGKAKSVTTYSNEFIESAKIFEKSNRNSLSALSTDPDEFMCYVNCIMQETSVWCAAATVQQTLSTIDFYHSDISITLPSQQSIMNTLGSGPALQPIIDYINNRQSVNEYIKYHYAYESDLLYCLSYASDHSSPTILHMNANSANVNNNIWPYYTNGHYTNLDGKTYDGRWVVSDPYYYEYYIPNAEYEGFHFRTYSHIATVNGNKYGSNNKTIAF